MIPTHDIDPDQYHDQLVDTPANTDTEAYQGGVDLGNQLVACRGADLDLASWLDYLDRERAAAELGMDDPNTSPSFRSTLAGYSHTLARFILENS